MASTSFGSNAGLFSLDADQVLQVNDTDCEGSMAFWCKDFDEIFQIIDEDKMMCHVTHTIDFAISPGPDLRAAAEKQRGVKSLPSLNCKQIIK
jgi:hypothetical protein